MARVDVVNSSSVSNERTAYKYQDVNINPDAFGLNVIEARKGLTKGALTLQIAYEKFKSNKDRTSILELINKADEVEQALYNKDTGYFYQTGINAKDKSGEVMQNYDRQIEKLFADSGLYGENAQRARAILSHKRENISKAVNAHDYKESINWAKQTHATAINNIVNKAVLNRNNPDEIQKNLKDGFTLIDSLGQALNLDTASIQSKKDLLETNIKEYVLNSLIEDKSLNARNFFETNKTKLTPEHIAKFESAIKRNENRYIARTTAQNLMALDEESAYGQIETIKDIDLRDDVRQEYQRNLMLKNRLEAQQQDNLLNAFYETALQKEQSGNILTYDDIPAGLEAKTELSLRKYIDDLNKSGDIETDLGIWQELYEKSVNDAQGFKNLNLLKYKGYLSDGDYKTFLKRQEDIKTLGYTQIKDDDKIILQALKTIGLDRGHDGHFGKGDRKEASFNEIRSYTREYEARRGRKITDNELLNFIKSLGYENPSTQLKLYQEIAKGMNERAGFMREVVNDFVYFERKNKRQPSDEEKYKIVTHRLSKTILQQQQETIEKINKTLSNSGNTKYDELILKYSQKYEIDPNLVKAVIKQESGFNPDAKSKAGALGLMQLMPQTAKGLGVKNPLDPEQNIEGGTRLLKQLLTSYNGNIELALAAYNAGSGAVKKYNGIPPYKETRNYVKNITAQYKNNGNITQKRIKIKTPSGQIVLVPENKVQEAINMGGIRL